MMIDIDETGLYRSFCGSVEQFKFKFRYKDSDFIKQKSLSLLLKIVIARFYIMVSRKR